ncbi:MAG: hypothetical protein A2498_10885 [Lentisphaerae bacterium RIFOXYC12_FULL_60_16]|nr:MAG: hypothetical protein A2498_10885 [Lentisphaerae bacterium RIFOXYC12_FULL_60_16]
MRMKGMSRKNGWGCSWVFGMLLVMHLDADPAWWAARHVTTTVAPADYAAATAGQLKWMATAAAEELQSNLPGGAGSNVWGLVAGFSVSGNTEPVNLGQLKRVAEAFYERLIAEGVVTGVPWTPATDDDADFAMANIGQLKRVFDFDLTADADADGLADWWEWIVIRTGATNGFSGLADVNPDDDFDGDGFANAYEYEHGMSPIVPDTHGGSDDDIDGDGLPDDWEMQQFGSLDWSGGDDPDGDGWGNLAEYQRGGVPLTAWRVDTGGILGLTVKTPLRIR